MWQLINRFPFILSTQQIFIKYSGSLWMVLHPECSWRDLSKTHVELCLTFLFKSAGWLSVTFIFSSPWYYPFVWLYTPHNLPLFPLASPPPPLPPPHIFKLRTLCHSGRLRLGLEVLFCILSFSSSSNIKEMISLYLILHIERPGGKDFYQLQTVNEVQMRSVLGSCLFSRPVASLLVAIPACLYCVQLLTHII